MTCCVVCGRYLDEENSEGVTCKACSQVKQQPVRYCYECGEPGVIVGTIYCQVHRKKPLKVKVR